MTAKRGYWNGYADGMVRGVNLPRPHSWRDRKRDAWTACVGVGTDTVARYRSSIACFHFWHDDVPTANDFRETVAFHRRGDPYCTAQEAV